MILSNISLISSSRLLQGRVQSHSSQKELFHQPALHQCTDRKKDMYMHIIISSVTVLQSLQCRVLICLMARYSYDKLLALKQ